MKKFGFTLAEVLITLGVIGVVAAITMPTLIQNHQKKVLAEQLKVTFSLISQSIEMSQANIENPNWVRDLDGRVDISREQAIEEAEQYVTGNLKKLKVYGYIAPNMYLNEFPTYKTMNGARSAPTHTSGKAYYTMKLANGSFLFYFYDSHSDASTTQPIIYLDVNGAKGPNILGKDLFFLFIDFNGKLNMVSNRPTRDEVLEMCKDPNVVNLWSNCAALIMYDGWKISDDYPW